MASKPKPGQVPAQIDPDAVYRVTLSRAVPFGGAVLRPGEEVRVKGKVIAALGDAVTGYEPA